MPRRAAADAVTSEAEDEVVTSIDRYDEVDVFVGLDVGKGEHHAVALSRAGGRLFDKALPNELPAAALLVARVRGHGDLLVALGGGGGAVLVSVCVEVTVSVVSTTSGAGGGAQAVSAITSAVEATVMRARLMRGLLSSRDAHLLYLPRSGC